MSKPAESSFTDYVIQKTTLQLLQQLCFNQFL